MSLVYNFADSEIKYKIEYNDQPTTIYLCEITRNISMVNSLESEVCVETRNGKAFNSQVYSLNDSSETFKTTKQCGNSENISLKENDSTAQYDVEIEVLLRAPSEKLKLTNITYVFPKNYETIGTKIFEVEFESNIILPTDTEMIDPSSTESLSITLSEKELPNRELSHVHPILYFNIKSPKPSQNPGSSGSDTSGTIKINCDGKEHNYGKNVDPLKNLENFRGEYMGDRVQFSDLNCQDQLKSSLDSSPNEYLDFYLKPVHNTIDEYVKTAEDHFKGSTDNWIYTNAVHDYGAEDFRLNNYISYELNANQNIEEIPNIRHHCSTDYETCSSFQKTLKLKKTSSNETKDLLRMSSTIDLDHNDKPSTKPNCDLETVKSVDYNSQARNDINIRALNLELILNAKSFHKVHNNIINLMKRSCLKAILRHSKNKCDTFYSTNTDSSLPKDFLLESTKQYPSFSMCSSRIDSKKDYKISGDKVSYSPNRRIHKLMEQTLHTSISNVILTKLSQIAHDDNNSLVVTLIQNYQNNSTKLILIEMIGYAWAILKDVTSFVYFCGVSYTNNISTAITRVLIKFSQEQTIPKSQRIHIKTRRKTL